MAEQARYERTPEGHRRTVATGKVFIDMDRGISQRITRGGVKVCMYTDEPGRYWSVKGEAIPEAVAKLAGFQVERHKAEREFRANQKVALEALARAREGQGRDVVTKRGPFTMIDLGKGLAVIEKDAIDGAEGGLVTPEPAPYAYIEELFLALTAELPEELGAIPFTRAKEMASAEAQVRD